MTYLSTILVINIVPSSLDATFVTPSSYVSSIQQISLPPPRDLAIPSLLLFVLSYILTAPSSPPLTIHLSLNPITAKLIRYLAWPIPSVIQSEAPVIISQVFADRSYDLRAIVLKSHVIRILIPTIAVV